jgi:hypothetical protein
MGTCTQVAKWKIEALQIALSCDNPKWSHTNDKDDDIVLA